MAGGRIMGSPLSRRILNVVRNVHSVAGRCQGFGDHTAGVHVLECLKQPDLVSTLAPNAAPAFEEKSVAGAQEPG